MLSSLSHIRSISDRFMVTAHIAYAILSLFAVGLASFHLWSLGAPVAQVLLAAIVFSLCYAAGWFVVLMQRNYVSSLLVCLVPVYGMLLVV